MFPQENEIRTTARVARIARIVAFAMCSGFIVFCGTIIAMACGLDETKAIIVGLGTAGLVFGNHITRGLFSD
jgi:hypothetical protein